MPSALASLLSRSLDFAGLFPPASLPVVEAVRILQAERAGGSAAMLGRFVCPVLRVEEVVAALAATDAPIDLAVLPRGGKTAGEFLANLETDLTVLRRVTQIHDGAATCDTIELRPPTDALAAPALRKLVAAVQALVGRHCDSVRQVFIELAPSPVLASQLEVLGEHSSTAGAACSLGYKLRTGGSDAGAVPSAAQVATALGLASSFGLPMKCTGGLHRPLRSTSTEAPLHGFINLLVAAAFASTIRTEPGILEMVIEETAAEAFRFQNQSLAWRGRTVDAATIKAARRQVLLSFGSCYVDRPRIELRKLEWWPGPTSAKLSHVTG